MSSTASAPEESADAPDTVADPVDAADWIRGFHGALMQLDGVPSSALRDLAMVHRSSGIGDLRPLVRLPGAGVPGRLPPEASGGARPLSARRDPVAEGSGDASVAPPLSRLPQPRQPEDAPSEPTSGRPAPARISSAQAEPLTELIDRRLAEARFLLLPNRSRAYAVSKRLLDLVLGSVLLVLASPVMAVLAILIRLDSPGPALFAQERVTRGGRTFRFYKFRTMYADARDRFPELYDYRLSRSEFESAYYKLADDPRNTRVGRWLRRTTLDEMPNLINVVAGQISLVGPRPDLPDFVRLYRPEELCCLFTKAGLTGVAQVAGRSLLTVRERLALDMRYVARQTLLLDLRILWRTVVVVLSGRGAF